ncbi:hypothetical protein CEXT_320341 [Caerostris extrusa]|uniref:Uncharacterized protein n=1 Tax=Caerostris extrusa TaxID=172846 RepID=A0AAV4P9S8_CAEEX|nr:hypothetical protein CEXT_320341 [Caerostris extrusa]
MIPLSDACDPDLLVVRPGADGELPAGSSSVERSGDFQRIAATLPPGAGLILLRGLLRLRSPKASYTTRQVANGPQKSR